MALVVNITLEGSEIFTVRIIDIKVKCESIINIKHMKIKITLLLLSTSIKTIEDTLKPVDDKDDNNSCSDCLSNYKDKSTQSIDVNTKNNKLVIQSPTSLPYC